MKYLSLSRYLKNEYGEKYFKLSLSCSTSCPNRDGVCGEKGCIFCSMKGSGDFAQSALLPISTQIENAKALVRNKNDNDKYIAYFQAFTSTYGDEDYLEKVFYETINRDDIAILSIATRPDCISDNMISILKRLSSIKPVWIELGLQSVFDSTAEYIRRGYKTQVYFDTVQKLRKINVHIITHVIIGLPNETEDMIIETVKKVGEVTDGIKLQLLHVLKNTDLEKDFNEQKFQTLSMEEYADILCKCISVLPQNVVIHRLTGDGDKNTLISPLWTRDKKRVLNYINHRIAEYDRI